MKPRRFVLFFGLLMTIVCILSGCPSMALAAQPQGTVEKDIYLNCLRNRLASMGSNVKPGTRDAAIAKFLEEEIKRVEGRRKGRPAILGKGPEALPARTYGVQETESFFSEYIDRQSGLASAFSSRSNEVFRFSEEEILGEEIGVRKIALTIDDGPSPVHTGRLLDALGRLRIKASFFLIGSRCTGIREPDIKSLLTRMLAEGHEIGVHGWEHLPHDRPSELSNDIDGLILTVDTIGRLTGNRATLFRAPYGRRSPELVARLSALRLRHVLWNIDSLDWRKDLQDEEIVKRVVLLARLMDGGIVLFHDFVQRNEQIIPKVVELLRDEGFTFCPLSRCLHLDKNPQNRAP